MRGNLADGRRKALVRPPGYFERLCAAGTIIGDQLDIPDNVHAALCAELRATYAPLDAPPRLDHDLGNYDLALAPWRDAGIRIVPSGLAGNSSQPTFLNRRNRCQSDPLCPYFAIAQASPAGRCELLCTVLRLPCSPLPFALAAAACPLQPPLQRWCSVPASAAPSP